MSSFLDLPPEIRLIIYNILLQSTLAKDTRILYFGDNPLRSGIDPDCIRHKQPFKRIGPQGDIRFLDTKSILARHIARAQYTIHLADIDDLLFLASTSRLIRSELLALAWSSADVHIESPDGYKELHCVFYDRLTSESCTYIRTLQFSIDSCQWSPSETIKVIELIRVRLPQVEQLIVNGTFRLGHGGKPFAPGVAVLKSLPPHIAVELRKNPARNWSRTDWNAIYPGVLARKDEHMNAHLQYLRMKFESLRQKRQEKLARMEQGDQMCDALEATVGMRTLMAG
ncbi:hypothetical protein KCU78_g11981, partial [Aureobasidium melanogenum]